MLKSSKIIKNKINQKNPEVAVILGSGLENFFNQKQILNSIQEGMD